MRLLMISNDMEQTLFIYYKPCLTKYPFKEKENKNQLRIVVIICGSALEFCLSGGSICVMKSM